MRHEIEKYYTMMGTIIGMGRLEGARVGDNFREMFKEYTLNDGINGRDGKRIKIVDGTMETLCINRHPVGAGHSLWLKIDHHACRILKCVRMGDFVCWEAPSEAAPCLRVLPQDLLDLLSIHSRRSVLDVGVALVVHYSLYCSHSLSVSSCCGCRDGGMLL